MVRVEEVVGVVARGESCQVNPMDPTVQQSPQHLRARRLSSRQAHTGPLVKLAKVVSQR